MSMSALTVLTALVAVIPAKLPPLLPTLASVSASASWYLIVPEVTLAPSVATNNVATLGASVTSGTIKYQDADALTLANVGSNGGNFAGITATNAVSTVNADID